MPVLPSDFLALSKRSPNPLEEIDIRNSVSRAYYAAYLEASSVQKSSPAQLPPSVKGGVHARLIAFYEQGLFEGQSLTLSQQIRIAGLLRTAKRLRVKADYQLDTIVAESDMETCILLAEEVMKTLT